MKNSEMNKENNIKEKGFLELLWYSLIGLFLKGVSSKDDKEYNLNLKHLWTDWLKAFPNKFMRLLKKTGIVVAVFIIINIAIFIPINAFLVKGKPYPIAKSLIYSAVGINKVYIYPLSALGWENPLTWPFYLVRDGLYNIGMSLYPEDEGEREVSWYVVRFDEFMNIVSRQITKNYSIKKMQKEQRWINELYLHIEPFSKAKISDPDVRRYKLTQFVSLAKNYVELSRNLYLRLEYQVNKNDVNYVNKELASNYNNIYRNYIELKKYSQKYEEDSYNYFLFEGKYHEAVLLYVIANEIIDHKFNIGKLSCDDPYIKVFGENHTKIRNYYENNKKNLTPGENMYLSMIYSAGIKGFTKKIYTGEMCLDNPYLQDYKQYFIEKAKWLGIYKEGENK